MSCIVYVTNKKTNTKYAYRSESYRDPVTKAPKSHRTYLGRVDPLTNEIIPKAEKGKRNRSPIGGNPLQHKKPTSINVKDAKDAYISKLRKKVKSLHNQYDDVRARMNTMESMISEIESFLLEIDC